ncbi:8626_t:CDS:2 [Entrophospora sp. SA101]|nr:8626_t:CDS:2 [Entrophospora sp. SA101]CAJ0881865.1 16668_t:CDS:2 [Entrophospora sp. SA101]
MYQQPPPQPLNNNKNNNALSYYPQNSVSPPPLQHPIPTHPPIQPWSRLVIRSQQNGQMEGYMPPREDINSPDLYIPGTFFYAAFANGFFLLRSLRYVVFPDSTNTVQVPQRKRRIHFLFVVSALQVLLMYYLIHKKQ